MKAAFLDRDGTIVQDYPDPMWSQIKTPEFLPKSILALKRIQALQYKIIIVTNQYIINEGIITLNDYFQFQNKMLARLEKEGVFVLETFFCPHTDSDQCECKKPKTGLIEQALKKYPNISLSDSFMVGDTISDALLAQNLNMESFIISDKPFDNIKCTYVNSLYEVSEILEKRGIETEERSKKVL